MISVTARELEGTPYLGSVFDAKRLDEFTFPPDLRLALDVVAGAYTGSEPLRCVARPEMFTHGRSLEWLRTALPGVTDHLFLSDGTTLKLIPGLINHVFVYGLQSLERRLANRRLLRLAPELWPQFASQVNSHIPSSVPAVSVLRHAPVHSGMLWFYPFYLNRHSVQDSVDRVLSWGEPESVRFAEFASVIYLPLTDCASKDPGFQPVASEAVVRAYFDPGTCLIIRLPLPGAPLSERITLALKAINGSALRVPRVRSKNIFFVADELPESQLLAAAARLKLILHPSVEFWSYTRALYAATATIVMCLEIGVHEPPTIAQALFRHAFGRLPDFIRMYSTDDECWMACL